ncbi:MAG: hypothetical protein ACE5JI_13150 [Acidobacteriota bacterium]
MPSGSCLVLGFLGGRDAWNDSSKSVRQLALRLRAPAKGIHVETFENRRRPLAEAFLTQALDCNDDGAVDLREASRVSLVVYGQSFGGAAVAKFARRLATLGIPILLTVQIDSVGRGDADIPPNVRYAANLYQDNGWFIEGEHPIRAVDPERTQILGNWKFDYRRPPGSSISLAGVPWWKLAFRVAHARMDRDPRVWARVGILIRAACAGEDLKKTASQWDSKRL